MKIRKVSYNSKNFKEEFIKSLKDTGFAIISDTSVSQELVQKTQADWKNFFNKPLDEKMLFKFNEDDQSGYFPYLSENAKDEAVPDLKEFFHIFNNKDLPSAIEQKNSLSLRNELFRMGLELLSYIEKDLNTEPELFQKTVKNCARTLFRVIYYPALNGDEVGVRAAAHEDINLITLLPAQSSGGLEAQDSKGNWHPVIYEVGDLVVNVGDMLQMFSKGEYKSTTHKVSNPKDLSVDRISMPLFMHPEADFDLKEMTAGAYLDKRLREIGLIK